jgi:hypothetical protein
MAEIGMLREVWEAKLQLCWWHLHEAVKEWLKKAKLSTTLYNIQQARSEFCFIDEDFVPPGMLILLSMRVEPETSPTFLRSR